MFVPRESRSRDYRITTDSGDSRSLRTGSHTDRTKPIVLSLTSKTSGRSNRIPGGQHIGGGAMSKELFLARSVLDAVFDPYLPRPSAEAAAGEWSDLELRFGSREAGMPIDINGYEAVRALDLTPTAWIGLFERAELRDPEPPNRLLDEIYDAVPDEVVRLRLVSAAMTHPRLAERFSPILRTEVSAVSRAMDLEQLPRCWGRHRIERIQGEARENPRSASDQLEVFGLLLLQVGTDEAIALTAAAVKPHEQWRESLRRLALNLVRNLDPNFTGFGRFFAAIE